MSSPSPVAASNPNPTSSSTSSSIPSYVPHLDTLNDYASQHQLHPLLKQMITTLFQQQPTQPIQFMIEFLQQKAASSSSPPSPTSTSTSRVSSGSNTGSLPVLSVDGAAASAAAAGSRGRNRRSGVSAEPIDTREAAAADATPIRVIPKNDQQVASIRRAVANNFLFANLDEAEMKQVIDAMQDRAYSAGDTIIKQGDPGDEFFVLDSGECACFLNQPNGEAKKVKVYQHSESFGELALMYGVPRAATIKATTNVLCWVMDRVTFRRLLLGSTSKKRSMYESFLARIPVLSGLDRYERAKVADALQEQTYKDGEYIIKQGDSSADHRFYFLADGEAVATKSIPGVNDGFPVQVWHYKQAGDFFGELALLHDAPRAANVIAKGTAKCCSLDRDSFVRLLGPIEQILNRTSEAYQEKEREIAGSKSKSATTSSSVPSTSSSSSTSTSTSTPTPTPATYITSPSTPEQRTRIREWLQQDVICTTLDATQQQTLTESINQRRYPASSIIIQQGSSHDYTWYMLAEGTCEVLIDEQKVRTYTSGSSFGEECFINNTVSRSATVRSVSECVVFVLDRSLFQRLIAPIIIQKRTKYQEAIQQVPLLSSSSPYTRHLVVADMTEATFEEGSDIIKQGDTNADAFYILLQGEARALKTMPGHKKGLEVMSYSSGDFFGELSLLHSEPRAATVQAINGSCVVGVWSRCSFLRLFSTDPDMLSRFAQYRNRYQAAESAFEEQRI